MKILEKLSKFPEAAKSNSDDINDTKKRKKIMLITGNQGENPLRWLSGLVKEYCKDKYEVDIINLGTKAGIYEHKEGGYPEELKKEILEFIRIKRPELIGLTMIDFGIERLSAVVKEVAQLIKDEKMDTKIVAGGPFAIEHSQRCIDIEGIDMICYSKGWEFADLVEAVSGNEDITKIPGLMIKTGKINEKGHAEFIKTVSPDCRIAISDQPIPDNSLKNTWMIHEGKLVNKGKSGGVSPVEHHQYPHKHTGVLIISEGCVNKCKFCSITAQRKAMKKHVDYTWSPVNFLKPEKAINLIKDFLKENPNTEYIMFNDNDFTARDQSEIKEFCKLYKSEIGLPFYCQCSPNTALNRPDSGKIDLLREAGMDTFDTGVQGSQEANIAAKYERSPSDEQVLSVARSVSPHLEKRNEKGEIIQNGLKTVFDFINGNEIHSKENMLSTFELIKNITRTIEKKTDYQGSWNLAIHNLTLDKDRDLAIENARRREAEGTSVGEVEDSDYHNATVEAFYKCKEPYYNILLEWMGGLHDQVHLGRIPRYSKDFITLIEDVLNEDEELNELVNKKKDLIPDTINLLTDEEIYAYLGNRENPRAKETLKLMNEKIPEINYSYHRPDRYSYDYAWAQEQLEDSIRDRIAKAA